MRVTILALLLVGTLAADAYTHDTGKTKDDLCTATSNANCETPATGTVKCYNNAGSLVDVAVGKIYDKDAGCKCPKGQPWECPRYMKNSASYSSKDNKQYQQGAVCCINKKCANPTDSVQGSSSSFFSSNTVACDNDEDKSAGSNPVHYDRPSKELCIDELGWYGKICNNGDCYSSLFCNWEYLTGTTIDSGDWSDQEFDEKDCLCSSWSSSEDKAVATILIIVVVVAVLGIIGCIICCVCCCKKQKAAEAANSKGTTQMSSA